MSFSNEWESIYARGEQQAIWPWSDLVSAVSRIKAQFDPGGVRVLELGAGAGANIPFFLTLGFEYQGVEGSPTTVERLLNRFPQLEGKILCADFSCMDLGDYEFDLIVDRASVTHNTTDGIRATLDACYKSLKVGGYYIGIDWFSTKHSDIQLGLPDEDDYTFSGFAEGQFRDVGRVHFSDEAHIRDLFSNFSMISLQEKAVKEMVGEYSQTIATWNFTCVRTK